MIEVLAVIVILSMLVLVAIPAVTNYLTMSRQRVFADNAKRAIGTVQDYELKKDYLTGSSDIVGKVCEDNVCYYDIDAINKLLSKKMKKSPFGGSYNENLSKIKIDKRRSRQVIRMCLVDEDKNGFSYLGRDEINPSQVKLGTVVDCKENEIWAVNLSYDNKNTKVNCDDAQCMIDYIANIAD